MKSLIYEIMNVVTKQKYVGWTNKSANERFKVHVQCAKRGDQSWLYNSIRKYGEDKFTIRVLEKGNGKYMLKEREQYYISKLSKKERLNITDGGVGGKTSTSFKKGNVSWNNGKKSPKHSKIMKEYWDKWKEEHPNYKDKWKVNTRIRTGLTEEGRQSMKNHMIKLNRLKVKCPHCDVSGNVANMKRWHFDNCNDHH